MFNIILESISADIDMCRMPSASAVYPLETALQCINAPKLTKDVFEQNQYSVEQLVQMYGFHDISRIPPQPFQSTAIDIDETLAQIRNTYESLLDNGTEVNAYDYYSELSQLFLTLKDPHTLFVKPNFYNNFRIRFPFYFENDNGTFYSQRFDSSASQYNMSVEYQQLFGDFEFANGDQVFKINGVEPIEWFQYMANKYDYSSKTDHGRLNSWLSSSMYNMRLDVYNMMEEKDQTVTIEYLSGLQETYRFIVSITNEVKSSQDAQNTYNKEIHGSPYVTNAKKVGSSAQKRFLETIKHEQYVPSTLKLGSGKLKSLLSSPNFFNLYKYGDDYVIQITSFSPDDLEQSLIDLLNLTQIIGNTTNKIYVDVRGNGGGWTSLGHLFANVLAHNEFPIYGQYNMRKSNISELLVESDAEFLQMHRLQWISGQELPENWYNMTTNQNYTTYYTFDDDEEADVYKYSSQLYNTTLNYQPNQIILISDSQCGSTCATFSAHLQEMSNCYSILFAGASSTNYSVESFAGGNVEDSQEYEDSIKELIEENWNGLNQSSIDYLSSIWLPHNGYQRFAVNMIYSFDPSKPAGIPDEYRLFPPNYVTNELLPSIDWQSQSTLEKIISIASQVDASEWYGEQCDSKQNEVYRLLDQVCVKHGCEYGYYRYAVEDDYICKAREDDPWLVKSQQDDNNESDNSLSAGAIAGIVIGVVVAVALIAVLIWYFVSRKHKYEKIQVEETQPEQQ